MKSAFKVAMMGLVLTGPLSGCGKEPPPPIIAVEGVVLLDGAPLNNVQVRFMPQIEHGAEYIATGVTDRAGRFQLMCNGQSGACAGENYVVIAEAGIPARLQGEEAQAHLAEYLRSLGGRPLPPRYANPAESPLTAQVSETSREFVFALER
jgi:hypothetical protein